MASKHSGSQWFASIFLTAALASSPLTLAGPTSAQGQFEAPVRADAPQGYGDWSALRVTLELRSANDYVRATKVVSRWLGELPKSDARYPLQMRALVTGAEQERLTRMGIRLALADELNAMLEGHAKDAGDTVKALKPVLSQLNAGASERILERLSATDAESRLRSALVGLSAAEANGLNALTSLDDDGDGLTNTQEAWWCTNPLNADSDGDGATDAVEVQQAKDWVGNLRGNRPQSGAPFQGWPMILPGNVNNPTCSDSDADGIPGLAEVWELGLNPNKESTDGDKFDDGQELFGITPGNWGALPRAVDSGYISLSPPSWLKAPGNHPFAAAYPDIRIEVVPSSLIVKTVTEIKADQTIMTGTERTYATTKLEGTSVANTDAETFTTWQETSVTRAAGGSRPNPTFARRTGTSVNSISLNSFESNTSIMSSSTINNVLTTINNTVSVADPTAAAKAEAARKIAGYVTDKGIQVADFALSETCDELNCKKYAGAAIRTGIRTSAATIKSTWDALNKAECPADLLGKISCKLKAAGTGIVSGLNTIGKNWQDTLKEATERDQQARGQNGGQRYNISGGEFQADSVYPVSFPMPFPEFTPTETNTSGSSQARTHSTTHTKYEENSVTNGEAFSTNQGWTHGTAINSAHAADMWFAYKVSNVGTDYARSICDVTFNVYIGEDPNPVLTYYPANDIGGDGCYHGFEPGETHTYSARTQSQAIPLTLDQIRAVDTGAPIRVVVEDYSYYPDDVFFADARGSGVRVVIDDGEDDGDDTFATFLIPTWGDGDTMEDVLGRYFPYQLDRLGNIAAVWTPESRMDTPGWCAQPIRYGASDQLWCRHTLLAGEWSNIYLDFAVEGTTQLKDSIAVGNSTALFKFNRDSDGDGYSDRSEIQLGTDRFDVKLYPKPELIAGIYCQPASANRSCTLSLLNTGTYDAYAVEAAMVAADDSISVTNGLVGGNGRVRAANQVIVGSTIDLPTPLPPAWRQAGHAKPIIGGYFTGTAETTYVLSPSCVAPSGCDVGSGTWLMTWASTNGPTGTLNFGAGYLTPSPLAMGSEGVKIALQSGKVFSGDSLVVIAAPPVDTFAYTVNRVPNTPPLVLVTYNDQMGRHQFFTSVELDSPSANLAQYTGQMLPTPGLEIVTSGTITEGNNIAKVLVDNPTGRTIVSGNVVLDYVDVTGTVASEFVVETSLLPGPNLVPVIWDTNVFSPSFEVDGDYLAIAFVTDYRGNILSKVARPVQTFVYDPKPDFAMSVADQEWDFGSAAQGTLTKRNFTFANVGLQDMLTYIQGVPGLSLSQTGSRRVAAADQTTYEIALNTIGLPVGVYDQSIVIRSSDPARPTQTVRVHGVVTIGPADGLPSGLLRPLDTIVTVTSGVPGTLVTFDHGLNQPSLDRLHPIKVFANPAGALIGVGKYATEFGVGVVDANMFGNGGDLAAPSSGNFDLPNGIGIGSINSGAFGSYAINVSNQQNSARVRAGNMVMLHQSRGANAGCWEINQSVTDFSGGTSIQAMALPLKCNYSSAGNDRAQVIRIPQYGTCSNLAGQYGLPASWNGSYGGILPIMCNSSFVLNGQIYVYGGNGATGTDGHPSGGVGGGFWGGAGDAENNDSYGIGVQGEGTAGPNAYGSGANGNGGGAGPGSPSTGNYGTGGGGGNGTAGGASTAGGLGAGGLMAGNPALTNMVFGGGGGGSNDNPGNSIGGGGAGGGIVVIFAPDITINGSIVLNGGNGGGSKWGAGGGAGGSALLRGRNVNFGISKITATGGIPGNRGGAGAGGRVKVEYCSTRAGSSNPTAIEAQISCYSVEQVEAFPFAQGRLNPPSYGTVAYNIQYGWRNVYASPGNSVATIRVPAGLISSVQFDVFGSQMSGTGSVAVDVANSPGVECGGTVANAESLVCNSTGLRDAFVAYWRSQNSPTSGTLDVPITITLDRAGQILLTNLQVQTTGSKVRYLQLAAQTYSAINLRYNVGQATNLAIDVGDDGSIDQSANVPAGESGLDLTTAIGAYLSTRSGVVNVPLRVFLSPFTTVDLVSFSAVPTLLPDASITLSDVSFSDNAPTESDTISVTAVLRNDAARDTGGLVASAFAILSGTSASYIGSAFVPSIPASGTATTEIAWNTIGFTGNVPVRIVLDPYDRVSETLETNNVTTRTLSIIARPDLQITQADSGGQDEVAAGEVLSLTLRVANHGQRAAVTETLAVYDGNPAQSGVLLGTLVAPPLGGGSTTDLVFAWQPTVVGEHKLFFRADKDNAVNEYDEGNNDLARILYVGVAGGYDVDSGLLSSDLVYSTTVGFGAIDTGQPDALQNCGPLPDDSYRRDPDGAVTYRFDRLLRARYYHLDIVLRDCVSGSNRLEAIEVNGSVLATGIDLNDGKAHYLSFLLDPKLYDERTITVKISAPGGQGAIVSRVTVREVLYRYVDAGLTTGSDTPWNAGRGYGWLSTYNVNTNCGPLPYQTARVNQSGNTLQYRFDGLDPAKRYKVALSLYQCTGSGVTQRLDIDGNVVGADLVAQSGSLLAVTRKVPQTVYQADGSIVVSIIRTNSTANAMIGEVILEEETIATAPVCEGLVRFTPYYSDVFGDVFINGIPAPAGTLVTAENPRGETVGCFAVATTGDYGYLRVFGEDTLSNPPIPGMRAGEPVRFRVDGVVAVGVPLLQWQPDSAFHKVDLNAGATQAQPILLPSGWNFISFRVEPPVPLIDNVLESIAGKYCRVLGLDGASNCALPEAFRTLKQMHSGSGYYTHITSTTSAYATVEGLVQPVDKPIPLQPGWNWIGYYPPTPLPVTVALQNIITYVVQVSQLNSLFVPGDPMHSTLTEMEPGKGYRVYISGTAPLTLTYPLTPALLMGSIIGAPEEKVDPSAAASVCSAVQPTPRMSFIYGDLGTTPGMPAGTLLEALTPDGKLAGCEVTRYAGQYGFMAVFGADADTPGYLTGEPILLRINGSTLRTTSQLWVDDVDVHRVDIAGAYMVFLPKIERAQTDPK